uniref:Uncharacterized protein n=1 Tax=Brassica oleracea var. oleracea TaxID=109376 RepID=A0A0D3AH47_BRAOL
MVVETGGRSNSSCRLKIETLQQQKNKINRAVKTRSCSMSSLSYQPKQEAVL